MRSKISSAIRRAVLLQLSLGAPTLLACGGSVVESGPTVDRQPSDGGGSDAAVVASPPPCVVTGNQGGGGSCDSYWFAFSGTGAQCGADDAGTLPNGLCQAYCPPNPAGNYPSVTPADINCNISSDPASGNTLSCDYGAFCGNGRRPAGLLPCGALSARDPVARYLARMAYLESASVDAFERLARELEAHGAPRALRSRALRAAKEEVRHARVVGGLAERAGAAVVSPRVKRGRVRGLEAVAIENAVEGCVNETFGAAVALVQAETASEPATRAAMKGIARDEARHADLAWAVARWIERRLDAPARGRVRRAREHAVRTLVRATVRAPDAATAAALGLPTARQARAIALALAPTLSQSFEALPSVGGLKTSRLESAPALPSAAASAWPGRGKSRARSTIAHGRDVRPGAQGSPNR
jgi:hypothetical protein